MLLFTLKSFTYFLLKYFIVYAITIVAIFSCFVSLHQAPPPQLPQSVPAWLSCPGPSYMFFD